MWNLHTLHTYKMKSRLLAGRVVQACNPSTQEAKAEDHEFEASLGHMSRSCLKKTNKKSRPFILGSKIISYSVYYPKFSSHWGGLFTKTDFPQFYRDELPERK
jgi:hypothetical protein